MRYPGDNYTRLDIKSLLQEVGEFWPLVFLSNGAANGSKIVPYSSTIT